MVMRPVWGHWALGSALIAVALCACGCGRQTGGEVQRVIVRGGPSLDALFAELADAYRSQAPNVEVVANFTCPPCILYRKQEEAPALDVFATIGDYEMDRLRASGKIDFAKTVRVGQSTLCIVTSERVAGQVRGIADLHTSAVRRIGVGDPENVAVGYYAKQALVKAGLWGELQSRFVFSQSGCELLKWVGLQRDVDAAIVFSICRSEGGRAVQTLQEFPRDIIPPVPLVLGLSSTAQNPEAAQRFMDFVAGSAARQILTDYHVTPLSQP
jgi:molybdate transport system substrate-binding protein